jgi:nucleotide-binding universal stress UspA family protein
MDGPIVVGTDGSDTATTALNAAIRLASAFDEELVIVSAYRMSSNLPSSVPAEFADLLTPLSRVESVLDDAASRARAAGVKASTRAVQGDPADAILDVADEISADLIVIGNKGIGSVKRFVLGNVPSKIVHNASCSTHIVHTT